MSELQQENSLDQKISQEKTEVAKTEVAIETKEEKQEDPNWRAFREARKKDREEKLAAEKRAAEKEAEAAALKAAMETLLNKSILSVPQVNGYPQNYVEEESEDQKIQRKIDEAIAKRIKDEEEYIRKREQEEYPNTLQKHFSDFNQTISNENLDYLEYHYPEVAAPLKRLPDGYDKWHDIYKAIKKFVPNHDNAQKDAKRIENNFNKPKSMSSSGMTQNIGPATNNFISKDRKNENWARMQRIMKGAS